MYLVFFALQTSLIPSRSHHTELQLPRKDYEVSSDLKSYSFFQLEKRGSSMVRHLPLVLEVPGSIPARGVENFGIRTRFLWCH